MIDPTRPVVDIMDRRREQTQIHELLRARRNLLVYGPRRMGKSSLLRRIAHDIRTDTAGDRVALYVDCTRHADDAETASLLLEAFAAQASTRWKRFWDWIAKHLPTGRTRIITDANGPRIEVDLVAARAAPEHSLPDALELIGRVADERKTPIIVFLDEFQVVMNRPEPPTWAMRSVAQDHPHLQLVLSGSVESVLRRLVDDRKAPFWKQLVEVPIDGIGIHAVLPDLSACGIEPDDDAVAFLWDACRTNTLRLMEVLQRLEGRGRITRADAEEAVDRIAHLHAPDYERDLGQVKPGIQRRCLLGLARDRPAHVMGKEFITSHDLGAQGNVQRALKRFRDLEILDADHRFLDPVFAYWLRAG